MKSLIFPHINNLSQSLSEQLCIFLESNTRILYQKQMNYAIIVIIFIILPFMQSSQRKNLAIQSKPAFLFMSFTIALGGFQTGYEAVCLSELETVFKEKNGSTDQQIKWILTICMSAFTFGAFIGPIFYRRIVQKIGERKTLNLIDFSVTLLILIQIIELTFYSLFFTRLFLGFFIGMGTAVLPSYLFSVSPLGLRGITGSFNHLQFVIGVLTAYLYGYLFNLNNGNNELVWRFFVSIPILCCVFRTITLNYIFPFDSLQRHIKKEQKGKIMEYIRQVYEKAKYEDIVELVAISTGSSKNISQTPSKSASSLHTKFFIISVVVVATSQFSGINAIMFYLKQLFDDIDDGNLDFTKQLMVYIGVLQFICSLIGSGLLDKFGRRTILLTGQSIVIFILFSCFAYDYLDWDVTFGKSILFVFIFAHVIVMNLTLGPVCVLIAAQYVDDMTYPIMTIKLGSMLVALTSQFMIKDLGVGDMFFIFGVLSLFSHLYLWNNLKQTKGITRDELIKSFRNEQKIQQRIKHYKIQPRTKSNKKILIPTQAINQEAQTFIKMNTIDIIQV